jgi:thiamine-phosphate pyrophosphorylase
MTDFGLYVIITNPTLPYTTIAEVCVKNGIKMLQLREKQLPDKELIRIGRQIKQITKGSCTSLVINDRPDI